MVGIRSAALMSVMFVMAMVLVVAVVVLLVMVFLVVVLMVCLVRVVRHVVLVVRVVVVMVVVLLMFAVVLVILDHDVVAVLLALLVQHHRVLSEHNVGVLFRAGPGDGHLQSQQRSNAQELRMHSDLFLYV